ncbi:RNA polymerase sigma factor [Sphingobacterium faecale]|uniref:RNA polymerase sigma factor n=1 Tax=Sphingobacterium faecale TaxID=2803775 RepID=A0ABS1R4Z8_9SPHI|nr:sigma-70 family RNA polymerase sigma factor [Sphingobacterium faecale]MBL1409791.1 sigma-70 family RNA polymerase sigma factor [Sphingobacterium faecale]
MRLRKVAYQEEEMLHLVRRGDPEAFEQLYHKYAKRISIKLVQLLKSEELAQDILQEVFIKIWNIREEINPELPFSSFLYRIAVNMSCNVYQRALKEQIILKEIYPVGEYLPIDTHIDGREIAELIEKALGTLTERQRQVYTMHKIEGLSYKEISEQLQISVSAINHHIQDASKRLRAYLKSYYPVATFLFILIKYLL